MIDEKYSVVFEYVGKEISSGGSGRAAGMFMGLLAGRFLGRGLPIRKKPFVPMKSKRYTPMPQPVEKPPAEIPVPPEIVKQPPLKAFPDKESVRTLVMGKGDMGLKRAEIVAKTQPVIPLTKPQVVPTVATPKVAQPVASPVVTKPSTEVTGEVMSREKLFDLKGLHEDDYIRTMMQIKDRMKINEKTGVE